ncbi:MAG TPA: NAD(P)H-dependent oxidoreductase subunit E, partial [Acidimicrobiales bacterium]|nr:NAD(P)H-dependent oxidoreductase subunit E [Acidimicrobiales bacterium]
MSDTAQPQPPQPQPQPAQPQAQPAPVTDRRTPGATTATLTHLSKATAARARNLIALYPEPRSALIPLCHLAQEQEGWLTPGVMVDIAALLDI